MFTRLLLRIDNFFFFWKQFFLRNQSSMSHRDTRLFTQTVIYNITENLFGIIFNTDYIYI